MRDIFAAMASMADDCVLEADALRQVAVDRTGLDDFGDRDYEEALDILVAAFRDEAGLSPPGVVSMHTQLVQLLVNRLRLTDLLRRHPEIGEIPITAPIVIAGLPRTGTTHLHNLLARRPGAAVAALLGEHRACARRPTSSRQRANPTRGWRAPPRPSSSSTRRCPTSAACTR